MLEFSDAVAYIHSLDRLDTPRHTHEYAFNAGIARTTHLLLRLGGAPHATRACILVAGSKGKGSTVAMLSSILGAAGYRCGAFTGPHLHTPLERFAIHGPHRTLPGNEEKSACHANGSLMPTSDFISLAERVKVIVESWDRPDIGEPTRFEAFVAMAYRWFEEQRIDIAVMEIGIGGRLDAVNLAEPMLSIITNISLEHTAILGSTLPQIAREKSGILRPGHTGVIAQQMDGVEQTLREEAARIGATLVFADDRWHCEPVRVQIEPERCGQYFRVVGDAAHTQPLFVPLLGRVQLQNAAAALAGVDVLRQHGFVIHEEAIRCGLEDVHWQGRFELLSFSPIVIADGAHTPYSMQQLCRSLRDYFPGRRIHLIIGVLRDKDAHGILHEAMQVAASLIFTQTEGRRALPARHLSELFDELSLLAHDSSELSTPFPRTSTPPTSTQMAVDLSTAFRQASKFAGPEDVVCVTGSLHLVAEAERLMKFQ
jgi:dihydrofolate synthase/folylpolyglutamate synthase